MSRLGRPSIYDPYTSVLVAYLAAILAIPQRAFAWGREGHQIILIPAELYMRLETATRMRELLALLFLGRKVQSEILRSVALSGNSMNYSVQLSNSRRADRKAF